ncbi:MAG TPA: hypothetical protein VMO26_26635 [Vicinamibacterales bacterium]|nr:hypothetical protein [Vicinamibacterales bacterium]
MRITWNVRAIARGKPSITVSAVENIVVTTAARTIGLVQPPSVPL